MLQHFQTGIPLSLYIHIPWCVRKCPYCDFNSHEQKDGLPEQAYVDALLRDLEQDMPRVWGRRLSSIFIGGGTPSLFSGEALDRLLSGVRALLPFAGDMEITLEANPGTVEAKKFADFRAAGINRLSIGVQSFNAAHLQALGRIHGELEARRAVDWAREAGFRNINLDLMHGLPGQSVNDALHDLQIAVDAGPTHLSWYQLTLEPNTRFAFDPPQLPEDDVLADIQDQGHAFLEANGFPRYEISAYASPEKRALHNCNYWLFGDYLGIGAGAHSKITDMAQQHIVRLRKQQHPKRYLDAALPFIAEETVVSTEDLPFEFMMNALRLIDGAPAAFYEQRTGLRLAGLAPVLAHLRAQGLLAETPEQLRATAEGLRFLNPVLQSFLPDEIKKYGGRKIIPILPVTPGPSS